MNKVLLLGRLGGDPEFKITPNGTALANLSIATTTFIKGKNGNPDQEKTQWHNVVVWGKRAENVRDNCSKGDQIMVEGELDYQNWEHEGKKYYRTVINASYTSFFKKGSTIVKTETSSGPADAPAFTQDDIPF